MLHVQSQPSRGALPGWLFSAALCHGWEAPQGQTPAPSYHAPPPQQEHAVSSLAKQLREGGGVENVNIRLAPWEIAHLSNHRHPHVSLQCRGVLGKRGGAEAGEDSDIFRSRIPKPARPRYLWGAGTTWWGGSGPQSCSTLMDLEDPEKVWANLGWCGQSSRL